jgi:predicted nucleotidyltransferase
MPIWRSDAQPAILHGVFYGPQPVNASAIAKRFGLARDTVNREARRLQVAGIVTTRTLGRSHVLELAKDHPAASALRTLVDLTLGPLVDLRALYDLKGVERVLVFGSWARRHLGEPGPTPRDVDVLVVGHPNVQNVMGLCLDVSGRLGVDVNPMIVSQQQLDAKGHNALLDEIAAGPQVEVRR